ncbi:hypothetical protein OESDEN_04784, partial [Oesophagostomum dentatum]
NWVADHESRVKFLTGFTGSDAKLVVTNDKAHFWTNSKFYKMAKNVLDPSITVMNECEPDTISVKEFLIDNLAAGDWVGIDPSLHCIGMISFFRGSGALPKHPSFQKVRKN